MNGELIIAICAGILSAAGMWGVGRFYPNFGASIEGALRRPGVGFRRTQMVLLVCWVLLTAAATVVGQETACAFVRMHVRACMKDAAKSGARVIVGKKQLSDEHSKLVIETCACVQFKPAHHSHATSEVTVQVGDNENSMILRLAQDSESGNEF